MASQQEVRRRSSAADRTSAEPALTAAAEATATATTSPTLVSNTADLSHDHDHDQEPESVLPAESAASNPAPFTPRPSSASRDDDDATAGRSRATSLAARNANRLSLTLPIAPPSSCPSRPTPAAATSSMPPTPSENSVIASPTDPGDFIIAIAAQERRVLELREELSRAEAELTHLKRQWSAQDTQRKRNISHYADSRLLFSSSEDDPLSAKRSLDVDRRKLILQNQSTPTQGRRKVIRGGHARTLSLLSPVKTDGGFPDLQDVDSQPLTLPPVERRTAQLLNPALSKRASWQPKSQQSTPIVPSIVEDFKLGFRAFVEDIRQITVGDEPVRGGLQDSPLAKHDGSGAGEGESGHDTIKPGQSARPKVSSALDSPGSAAASPTRGSKDSDSQGKSKAAKNKRFSWTPLGLDALDDNGWSNWESPASVKPARWSGSTINSSHGDLEDIQPIAEGDEESTPIKRKSVMTDAASLGPRLEEILPTVVNTLSPSNIKRTANHLLDEWEKSLVTPGMADKENRA
jgi:hypothetical protein